MSTLTELTHHCHAVLSGNQPLLWTLFSGGLIGSLTHCTGMCSPFVLSQTAATLDNTPVNQLSEWKRLRGAMLIPYHLGRMTTYTLLGVAAATMTVYFKRAIWFHDLAAVLLGMAAILFFIQALRFARLALPRLLPHFAVPVPAAVKTLLRQLFAAPQGWRGYALGIMLGFLPCGLVYAALMAVAAHGDPILAVPAMVGFSIGTVPVLVMTGMAGQFMTGRWRRIMLYGAPVLMFANSWTLFAMAGDTLK